MTRKRRLPARRKKRELMRRAAQSIDGCAATKRSFPAPRFSGRRALFPLRRRFMQAGTAPPLSGLAGAKAVSHIAAFALENRRSVNKQGLTAPKWVRTVRPFELRRRSSGSMQKRIACPRPAAWQLTKGMNRFVRMKNGVNFSSASAPAFCSCRPPAPDRRCPASGACSP